MKAQFRLSMLAVALFTMMSNVACTKSSSSDDSGGGAAATAAAAEPLALASISVATGSTTTLLPSGGTPPYSFTLQSTIGGNLNSNSAVLTAGNTIGTMTVIVTDFTNQTAQATITVTTAAAALTVSPLSTTVAPGGTVAYVVSGGSGTYTYSATAGTFSGATFTAPSAAQTVTVTISDGSGHSVQATVTVAGGNCSGTYNMNLTGYAATLYIVQDSTGHIAGSLTITGYGYAAALSGTCTSAGVIQFTDLYSQSPYTGTYFINPSTNKTVMTGTFSDPNGTYNWFAIAQ